MLRARLLQHVGELLPSFALRIVHPMTEAWLMADRRGFARYFSVRESAIPANLDALPLAKTTLLGMCAGSRSREIRERMVLPHGRTGPLYVATLNAFASTAWDVLAAKGESDSLRRAVEHLCRLKNST